MSGYGKGVAEPDSWLWSLPRVEILCPAEGRQDPRMTDLGALRTENVGLLRSSPAGAQGCLPAAGGLRPDKMQYGHLRVWRAYL
jgi:hypothetical protein